jgi:chloramphenicol 3-O-phosphotransferase
MAQSRGQLVVIAGTTGSGKTTSCRALLAEADDLWVHFGADLVLGTMIDRRFVDGGPLAHRGVHIEPLDPAEPGGPAELRVGEDGEALIEAMHAMAAAAVRAGQKVVMDHVPTRSPPLLQTLVATLKDAPVLLVALRPPREVLMERIDVRLPEVVQVLGPEQGRVSNERCKHASDSIYREIFTHDCFDLVLDTARLTPPQVARAILARLEEGPGTAFARLAERLGV